MSDRMNQRQTTATALIGRADLTFGEYSKINAVNWSTLKAGLVSMLHYRHGLDSPREDTPSLSFGRVVHCAVFEPRDFPKRYAVAPPEFFEAPRLNRATKEGKAFAAEWLASGHQRIDSADAYKRAVLASENPGREVVSEEDYDRALIIGDRLRQHREAGPYLAAAGRAEVTIEWVDGETGIHCKSRLDWLCDPLVDCDLKTAATIAYRPFRSQAWRFGYFHQMAFHRMGLESIAGIEPALRILAIESAPPYDCAVFEPEDDAVYAAGEEIKSLLLKLKWCRANDQWPGQYAQEEILRAPHWAMADGDEEATNNG